MIRVVHPGSGSRVKKGTGFWIRNTGCSIIFVTLASRKKKVEPSCLLVFFPIFVRKANIFASATKLPLQKTRENKCFNKCRVASSIIYSLTLASRPPRHLATFSSMPSLSQVAAPTAAASASAPLSPSPSAVLPSPSAASAAAEAVSFFLHFLSSPPMARISLMSSPVVSPSVS
jgi:hypothetical protein